MIEEIICFIHQLFYPHWVKSWTYTVNNVKRLLKLKDFNAVGIKIPVLFSKEKKITIIEPIPQTINSYILENFLLKI